MRRFCPSFVLFSLLLSSCSPTEQSESSAPNFIVILVDDLRWDEFGAAGHAYLKTPNIDRLASEGAMFTNAFTTMPLCSPSRAGFLTGQYAHTNGITDNTARNETSHRLQTFPRMLDTLGYETAFLGKWHMGNDDTPRPGFDHWVALKGQGEAKNPGLNINGERTTIMGYTTDILTDLSIDFIRKEREEPFLLYISHKALHPNRRQNDDGSTVSIGGGGFIPADRHEGMYSTGIFEKRPNYGITPEDKPALMRQIGDLPTLSMETVTPESEIRERAEMLMAVDDGLGRILQALEGSGQLDNTAIFFTSDHGYWYGEHGLSWERRLSYEEAIRIPFLVRYPSRVTAGSRPEAMTISLDLAATVIDLSGNEVPSTIQGRSLLPLLEGTADNWRNSFLVEYYSDRVFERMDHMGYRTVRTDRYKYIRYTDLEGMDEFYDLEADPYELNNLIDDPENQEARDQAIKELDQLLKQTGG